MDYPHSVPDVGLVAGRFVNENPATGQIGSIIPAEWGNALMTELFTVFSAAGIDPDEGNNTQLLESLQHLFVGRDAAMPVAATAPSVDTGPIVYVLDRRQILLWQTIGTFTGYASAEVGDFRWGTSITPKPGTELLIGQTIDRTLPQYAALIAWAEVNGHMVPAGSWEAGAFHFASLGGNSVRLPDLRNQFIRATGTDLDTANARVLGSGQEDAVQNFTGEASFGFNNRTQVFNPVGVFGIKNQTNVSAGPSGSQQGMYTLVIDASRVVRTSVETRGSNVALHPVICL